MSIHTCCGERTLGLNETTDRLEERRIAAHEYLIEVPIRFRFRTNCKPVGLKLSCLVYVLSGLTLLFTRLNLQRSFVRNEQNLTKNFDYFVVKVSFKRLTFELFTIE